MGLKPKVSKSMDALILDCDAMIPLEGRERKREIEREGEVGGEGEREKRKENLYVISFYFLRVEDKELF